MVLVPSVVRARQYDVKSSSSLEFPTAEDLVGFQWELPGSMPPVRVIISPQFVQESIGRDVEGNVRYHLKM